MINYINQNKELQAFCHVGNQIEGGKLGSFQDASFAGIYGIQHQRLLTRGCASLLRQSQSLLFELGLLGLRSTTPRQSQYSESSLGEAGSSGSRAVARSVPPLLQSLDLMKELGLLGLQRTAPRQKVVLDHLGPETVARPAQPLLQQM